MRKVTRIWILERVKMPLQCGRAGWPGSLGVMYHRNRRTGTYMIGLHSDSGGNLIAPRYIHPRFQPCPHEVRLKHLVNSGVGQ